NGKTNDVKIPNTTTLTISSIRIPVPLLPPFDEEVSFPTSFDELATSTTTPGISSDTLRRCLKQGKITAKTSPSGTRLYNISSIFPELTSQYVDNNAA
ncbi:528_t:CDS:2, partial [Ambispora leptoticha]